MARIGWAALCVTVSAIIAFLVAVSADACAGQVIDPKGKTA